MKAERRHELKTNALAHGLGGLPLFWARYGGKILLAAVAVLAVIWFARFKAREAQQRQEQAGASYAAARGGIANLQGILGISDPKAAAEQRKQLRDEADRALDEVLETTTDDTLKGEAWLARGELYWQLARLPEIRGADTQPALKQTESDEDLLKKARQAYESAAAASGAKQLTVVTARFGLAAIAEQRRQWDEARKIYESIRDDKANPEADPFKDLARLKLDDLKDIQKPVLIGKPATEPAIAPVGPPVQAPTTTIIAPAVTTTPVPATESAKPAAEEPADPAKPETPTK